MSINNLIFLVQGGSEQECLTWINDSDREPLPMDLDVLIFVPKNPRSDTCVGEANSVCSVIVQLVAAEELPREESDIWGCPGD